ncbi:MAG: transaldolase [Arcobacteraceae bacterium]|jgi:transaldolase
MNLKEDINYSIWCDFIEREFLENGFRDLVTNNIIHGATSNPAIFEQSISSSEAYTQQMNMLQANGNKKIYEELAITDIKTAAAILRPLHEKDVNDGFISLEVDPNFCDDTQATIEEGIRLHKQIGCDNLMIKVPATPAGYIAMEELTSLGINVNATLVFSVEQAILAAQALNTGITKSGKDTKSVVSIFVSRFDRILDEIMKSKGLDTSKIGIMNATKCYHEIEKFNNYNIRTLFASTGVKGDNLNKSYYIDNLIFKNSINTAPLATIKDWLINGSKIESEIISEDECDIYFKTLERKNINVNQVASQLLHEGLNAFKISFEELLKKIKL